MQVLAVNVCNPGPNPRAAIFTSGIDKRPAVGPVAVTAPATPGVGAVGLAGDRVDDVRHHGGPDQAVYAYAREDLDYWEQELGRALTPGTFGENLTTSGLDISAALIGERWRIGHDVVLEVSTPRIPCRTFQRWLGSTGWVKRFTAAARPGTYLRVLEPGEICAADRVEVVHRPDHDVTVAVVFLALTREPALLPRLLVAAALPDDVSSLVRRRTGQYPAGTRLPPGS
jgi:MOSC domain-containing protein YiiM